MRPLRTLAWNFGLLGMRASVMNVYIRRMRSLRILFLALCSLSSWYALSQEPGFSIAVEPVILDSLEGVQSYAFGQHDGLWLIVGGRLDGLHRRQPWATFDEAGHNRQMRVIDPEADKSWSADLSSLPTTVQEQLGSTNMEFQQVGEQLYCVGGYGYSDSEGDHTTFAHLTVIDVPDVIEAIIKGKDIAPHIRQISDPMFQVTGGKLGKIGDEYYLLGGQKFLGRYNPMGPDHGPGFIQEYTNSIRVFRMSDDGNNIEIEHVRTYTDTLNLHRRDYNAVPQIMPDGEEGITMFSGVFRHNEDLPFWNCVNVNAGGYAVNDSFRQLLNHYHCPVLPLYSSSSNEMHTIFFGGIAQYYYEDSVLWRDDEVPFVTTIAVVTRDGDGIMKEHKLDEEMPALLGAAAELIPNPDLPYYGNGVLKLDELESDTTMVGYIYGGIRSPKPNIFFINEGKESEASGVIYKVYLIKQE